MIYIMVDGSYYCFYRYYALCNWWKNAHPDQELGEPVSNPIFVEKFRSTFVSKLKELVKLVKRGLPKDTEVTMWVGKDCHRCNIWRMDVFPQYKANRTTDDSFMGGPFFAMAYNDDLFIEGGCGKVLKYPRLEADDCIALTAKHILNTEPDSHVWIIASDADYLQLGNPRIHIVDLKMKPINLAKKWSGDAQTDLFYKIVMGDPSDGIPAIVPKCGIKTAMKYHENPSLLEKVLQTNPTAADNLARNRRLIDFSYIPTDLIQGFEKKYL